MMFALVQLASLVGASQVAMMGHHHHHHHHHGAQAGGAPSTASIENFANGKGGDDAKMDPKSFLKQFDMGSMMSSVKSDGNANPQQGAMPDALAGLSKAASTGDEAQLMASIQSMAGVKDLPSEKDLHIVHEDTGNAYDLRGAFKHTQTVPPMASITFPPSAAEIQAEFKTSTTTKSTTTKVTKTTTSTTTTTSATTTTTTTVKPVAAKPQAQPAVQAVQTMLQPVFQAAGQPPVAQPAMQFMPQQVQQFQQFPQQPLQQFQQFPQQNAFLPPTQMQSPPGSFQALQNGLGQMMQTISAMSSQQAATARSGVAEQQLQAAQQAEHNAVEQLTQHVASLEAGKNSGHAAEVQLQGQLQAETAQVQTQTAEVKNEASKIEGLEKRVEALESTNKHQENDKQADILRRLDELEKKAKSSQKQPSTSSQAETELKSEKLQMSSFEEQLKAQKAVTAGLRAEVQKLKAKAEIVPPPPAKHLPPLPPHRKDVDDVDDEDDDVDDASFVQFSHHHREEKMPTDFHRKIRRGSHSLPAHKA